MNFPWLPQEIYVHIISVLPVSDDGITALARCLASTKALQRAASTTSLWEPHFHYRYPHDNISKDGVHLVRASEDWPSLYAARRRLDRVALKHLDAVIRSRTKRERCEHAHLLIVELGYIAWDVLDIEANRPLPKLRQRMQDGLDCEKIRTEYPLTDLTRRFWARELLGLISRYYAVERWGLTVHRQSEEEPLSFEESLVGFSAFCGVPSVEILDKFDALAKQCAVYLQQRNIATEVGDESELNIPDICTHICTFMRSVGFGAVDGSKFHELQNHFPHTFLTTNKMTLPMSLVCVFVAIARRLGLEASPVGIPYRVIAHVSSRNPNIPDTYVDVFGSETHAILSATEDIPTLLMNVGITQANMHRWITPSSSALMLFRTARNIFVSFGAGSESDERRYCADNKKDSYYAATCAAVLVSNDVRVSAGICDSIRDIHPLDSEVILRTNLAPLLDISAREVLIQACNRIEASYFENSPPARRNKPDRVSFHVGQLVRHDIESWKGCVVGWTPTAMPSGRLSSMSTGNLDDHLDQPFYLVLDMNGIHRVVPQTRISALYPVRYMDFVCFLSSFPVIGRYFSGVEFCGSTDESSRHSECDRVVALSPEDNNTYGGRSARDRDTDNGWPGRFLFSDEMVALYPDDAAYGAQGLPEIQNRDGNQRD
ncbi:hypothetical protein BD410DRAFT_834451 [Rickenella mellea]|uniref:Hemimethylated DNA-binding domain-containing protein n=1 Tax=Rickenella mellea TaxID=50990 RepID=A0A4Y7QL35_9AGAM|nr:hypothetical protein BD410DRAFT_834451 [Rickenella mellea]